MQATESCGRHLESMTWVEAEAALRQCPVVLVPLGARLKEHGLHLPLNNDFLLAEYLTSRVLAQVPALATPTVPFHYYPAFVEYPGSVHLRLETSRDLMVDLCRSLSAHGPRRFYVLNTGVSTLRALAPARDLLAQDGITLAYTDLLEALGAVARQVETQPGGTHADELETSMMLYLAPQVVRMERAVPDFHPARGPGPLTRDPSATTGVYSPTGAWGDPTRATVEKGQRLVEALVAHVVSEVKALSGR